MVQALFFLFFFKHGTSLMLAVVETLLENVAFFFLFTACKQAYLVVLTVNVIVVYF